MISSADLISPGRFVIGCNYWASHAGTRMWADWRPEVVERDLRLLSEAGLQLLRVFPLWPDFQPIHLLRTGGGKPVEIRHGEAPLPEDECGQAGMSAQNMAHFGEFLDLAEKYDLACNIGLLTGWMSGRLHVPPALAGLNVLTDPLALQWELRFVRYFVKIFKDHAAVVAWDPGNECNCMGAANSRAQAFTWTATIANAIRAADPVHPVASGLHGLSPTGAWSMQDQGELTDLLTTHPYPVFTPHCDQDPVNTIRTVLHSTAESRYYSDIGGKPCLCQEIGTLGPVIASEQIAADFIRNCCFSLWANDCHGLVWWCGFDQTELAHAPYDWHAVERELGLIRVDGSAKPVLHTLSDFRQMLEKLPAKSLPPHTREAVCIISEGQDHWGVAYSSYILAKQAGFDLQFQYSHQPLREAALYLLPCLAGHAMIPRRRLLELLAKVEAGATLYLSLDSGLPSHFEPITGLEPQTRERRQDFGPITLHAIGHGPQIPSGGSFKVRLKPTRAEVLGREEDGNPAFAVADYGRGKVFFLGIPLETMLANTPGALHATEAAPCWQVYRYFSREAVAGRALRKLHPMLAVTEHPLERARRWAVVINHSPKEVTERLPLEPGWGLGAVYHGQVTGDSGGVEVSIGGNDGAVFELIGGR